MAVLDLFIALVLTYQTLRKRTKGNMFNIIMHLVCMVSCPYSTAEVEFTNKVIVSESQVKVVYIQQVEQG